MHFDLVSALLGAGIACVTIALLSYMMTRGEDDDR